MTVNFTCSCGKAHEVVVREVEKSTSQDSPERMKEVYDSFFTAFQDRGKAVLAFRNFYQIGLPDAIAIIKTLK